MLSIGLLLNPTKKVQEPVKPSVWTRTPTERIHCTYGSGISVYRIQLQSADFISWRTMLKQPERKPLRQRHDGVFLQNSEEGTN